GRTVRPLGFVRDLRGYFERGTAAGRTAPVDELIWIETPSNPLLSVTDIGRLAALAHDTRAYTVCDNTVATPALQRPLDLGADLVIHSATKYLSGYSDVMTGVVVTRTESELFRRIRSLQVDGGAVPSPFDCWLVRRGIRSLSVRMQGHCAGAA